MTDKPSTQNPSNVMRVFYIDSNGIAFRTLHDNIFMQLREIIRSNALNEERNVRRFLYQTIKMSSCLIFSRTKPLHCLITNTSRATDSNASESVKIFAIRPFLFSQIHIYLIRPETLPTAFLPFWPHDQPLSSKFCIFTKHFHVTWFTCKYSSLCLIKSIRIFSYLRINIQRKCSYDIRTLLSQIIRLHT